MSLARQGGALTMTIIEGALDYRRFTVVFLINLPRKEPIARIELALLYTFNRFSVAI